MVHFDATHKHTQDHGSHGVGNDKQTDKDKGSGRGRGRGVRFSDDTADHDIDNSDGVVMDDHHHDYVSNYQNKDNIETSAINLNRHNDNSRYHNNNNNNNNGLGSRKLSRQLIDGPFEPRQPQQPRPNRQLRFSTAPDLASIPFHPPTTSTDPDHDSAAHAENGHSIPPGSFSDPAISSGRGPVSSSDPVTDRASDPGIRPSPDPRAGIRPSPDPDDHGDALITELRALRLEVPPLTIYSLSQFTSRHNLPPSPVAIYPSSSHTSCLVMLRVMLLHRCINPHGNVSLLFDIICTFFFL